MLIEKFIACTLFAAGNSLHRNKLYYHPKSLLEKYYGSICVAFLLPLFYGLSFPSYILISIHTSMRLMIIARECDRNGIIASGAADDAIRLFVENQEKGVLDTYLTFGNFLLWFGIN